MADITSGTGVKETVVAAPITDTGIAATEVDDGIDIVEDSEIGSGTETVSAEPLKATVKPVNIEPDRNAIYAELRRKAEAEAKIKVTAEAQKISQSIIDKAFADMGLTDPYTGKRITTKAEHDAYKERHEYEKSSSELTKAGLSRETIDGLIASNPIIKKAELAAKAYEQAKQREQDIAAKTHFDAQLKEIGTLDSEIKTVEDLMAQPNFDVIQGYIKKGLTAVESYKLANMDKLASKQSQAAAQSALNKSASKDHLTSTAVRGQGEAPITRAQYEQYKAINPKMTDKQIREHYANYRKNILKG